MQYAGNDVFPPSFEEVNDKTDRDAGSVNVGLEALADRTVWLKNRGLVAVHEYTYDAETLPWTVESFTSTSYTAGSNMLFDVPNTQQDDVLAVDMAGIAVLAATNGSNFSFLRAGLTEQYGGATPTTVYPAGARVMVACIVATGGMPVPFAIPYHRVITKAGTARIFVQGRVITNGDTLQIWSAARIRVLHYRPTNA